MAETQMCANHVTRQGPHRCKQCGKYLCNDCVMKTEIGLFCGNACYEQVKQFQQQIGGLGTKKKPGFLDAVKGWAKQLIGAAILLGVIWAVFYFALGVSTPGDILDTVKGWLGL